MAKTLTVSDLAREWIENRRQGIGCSKKLKPATLIKYEIEIENHLCPFFQNILVSEVSPPLIREFHRALIAKGLSGSLRRSIICRLKVLLRRSYVDGIIDDRRIVDSIELPPEDSHEAGFLSPSQFEKLLRSLKGHPDGPLIEFALFTGMRAGEIAALRWNEVILFELANGVVHGEVRVIANRCQKTGRLLLPKNGDKRVVPLLRQAADVLKSLPNRRGFVFGAELQPLTVTKQKHFARKVRILCEKAGVPSMPFHGLRHSMISWLRSQGVPTLVVGVMVGQRDLGVTERYSHADSEMMTNALNLRLAPESPKVSAIDKVPTKFSGTVGF